MIVCECVSVATELGLLGIDGVGLTGVGMLMGELTGYQDGQDIFLRTLACLG